MNKILTASFIFAVLLIAGCAQKDVTVSDSGTAEQESIQNNVADVPAKEEAPQPDQEVQKVSSGTVVGSVYFDFDKFNIKPDMENVIDESSQKIKDADMNVLIEGNTDEFGSDEYNYALGTKRALSVKSALIIKGIAKNKIKVISFGESKPVCQEKTKSCYQKNRRADIKLVK